MSEPSPVTAPYAGSDSASVLVRVLDEYLAALHTGTPPDKAELLARHPDLAGQLDSCLAALDFIHNAGTPPPSGAAPTQLGDFRIVREIGRGGMGVVFEAQQLSLGRSVALKVLRFGAADPGAMDRFRREAETVARLHHTNIVPVFAVGCEGGVHFYAMQLIDGEGLDKATVQKPDFATVAKWGVQAAEALAHAHTRNVIHRDIKPSNLLLDREGTVWLTDFGLARRSDEVTLTVTGVLMGTPRYMSPEQASATQQKVDARSDVYSLGATLYELATGKPVHDGDTPQRVLAQILQEEPTPPRRHVANMPRDLETVLLKCLAKEPNDRYGSAQELADDLRRFVNGDAIKARRATLRERAARWAKKHRKQVAVLALTALVSVGLAIGGAVAVMNHLERGRQRAQQKSDETFAHVWLTTQGPPLAVEVVNSKGEVQSKVAVPDEYSVVLWPGTYLLRISGPWKPVATRTVTVAPGEEATIALDVSGEVTFTTDGPPLVGEIQDDRGAAVVPPFPIPTEKPVVVPGGDYRVKLRGPWLPVEYEPLQVKAGAARKVELRTVGRLSLDSNGPPLMGEVLNAKGERVVPAFTLPTPDPVALPAGDHTLRLTGPGLWTENFDITLHRGERNERVLNLSDRAFGTPIKVTTGTGGSAHGDAWVFTHGHNSDVILLTNDGLKRIEWATGKQVWAEIPTHPDLDAAPYGGLGLLGKWGPFFHSRILHLGENDPRPGQARLVRPAPDLDGDGSPELLFSSRWVPGLMAVSWKTGKVLWYHTTAPPVSAEMKATGWQARPTTGCVPMGEPVLAAVEGNLPDVITAVHAMEAVWEKPGTKEEVRTGGGVWLEALSGKTGTLLWSSWLEESWGHAGQRAFATHLTKLDGKQVLAVLAGDSLGVFDVKTGKIVRGRFQLDFLPLGVPKVLGGEHPLFLVGRHRKDGDELVAVGALDGKVKWAHELGYPIPKPQFDNGFLTHRHHPNAPPPDGPVVADLDGDGKEEVLVPLAHKAGPQWDERSGGGCVALDGGTGKPRWTFAFPLAETRYENGYARIRVIPDVTGDGKPDVAVARIHWTIFQFEAPGGNYSETAVAVLSGADGKPVWQWQRRGPLKSSTYDELPDLGRLTTWAPGRDGNPQLVVPVYPRGAPTADLLLFDSGTGRLDREVKQFGEPIVADLDGDGLPELYSYSPGPPATSALQREFTLSALRGTCPDLWRRFYGGSPGPDLDGDGVPDLFGNDSYSDPERHRVLAARSGATGKLLWRCELDATGLYPYPQGADFNGDGISDALVLCVRRPDQSAGQPGARVCVVAVCGKTGRVLWEGPDLTGSAGGKTLPFREWFVFLSAVRLRANEPPAAVGLSWVWEENGHVRYYAFALSGSDGRVLWQTPVGPSLKTNGMAHIFGAPSVADLDGDGANDLIFWAGPKRLVALSGASGTVMWEREIEGAPAVIHTPHRLTFTWNPDNPGYPAPAVADLDGKGTFGVAFVHRPKDRDRIVMLSGKDGTERWVWEGPPVQPATDWRRPDALTPPRFVRLREGTFLLAVACGIAPPKQKGFSLGVGRHLVLLDAAGKERERRELPPVYFVGWNLPPLPLWVADLDGDGFDEIAFVADEPDRFYVTRDGLKQDAWVYERRGGDVVHAVRPASGGKPGTVLVKNDAVFRGFDGKTGKPVWACDGPWPGDWLPPLDPSALPIFVYPTGQHGTIARRAVPTAPDGKFVGPGSK